MAVTSPSAQPQSPPARDNQATIAKILIFHGALWLALIAYVWTAWIVSGDFKPNTIGRGLEPEWYVILVRCVEVVFGIGLGGWIIWHFIVRPKLKTGKLSFDGLFFLACWLMFFQEPWMNWMNLQFLYATTFVNFGSWLDQIPGWSMPRSQLIPVPLVYGMAYLWMVGLGGWAGSRYMARQRSKHPARTAMRLILQTFGVMVLVDFVVESIMVHTQLINYPRTVPWLTLWAGTDHQFPVYEMLAWPGTFILISSLHFFRDDKGRSWPERCIDVLKIKSGKLHTLARFAAIAGLCQLAILVAFNLPYQVWGLHAGPVPQSLLNRPWRMAGVCGPGTPYDCGGPGILMPRHDSVTNRVTPIPAANSK
ncbi:spirocyclase AveC family protein [Nocardia miyunensis]|uniref:spirocyclase AveC family protein n=1 Tax=Nocardia miyunensis TaxID=282684 RepID=UPI000834BB85|nr:spirocyclase AveC family protein [Nocardia miyunensis]